MLIVIDRLLRQALGFIKLERSINVKVNQSEILYLIRLAHLLVNILSGRRKLRAGTDIKAFWNRLKRKLLSPQKITDLYLKYYIVGNTFLIIIFTIIIHKEEKIEINANFLHGSLKH